MKCPVCKTIRLSRKDYQGIAVKACESCGGYLVPARRVPRIKTLPPTAVEQDETAVAPEDTLRMLNCPACSRGMKKEAEPVGSERFFVDRCANCELVWFDANELARLQVRSQDRQEQQKDRIFLILKTEYIYGRRGGVVDEVFVLTVHYPCPKCRKRLSAPAANIGWSMACRHCGHTFPVPEVPRKKQ